MHSISFFSIKILQKITELIEIILHQVKVKCETQTLS